MKTFIILITFLSTATCMYAKPIIDQMISKVEGQIIYEIPLHSHVKKGQLVEEVNSGNMRETVDKDTIDILYNKKLYDVDYKLYNTHSISYLDMQKTKEALEDSAATYWQDKSLLKQCKIYAPFDGKVTKIVTYSGCDIGDGNLIMEIQKDSA
ncbi:MAG TPA: hypothetical protein QF753_07915 [Victivallales bacterium]|nr:hypothetical protein [Victivallales bacterium]